jgi:hypothetical protein
MEGRHLSPLVSDKESTEESLPSIWHAWENCKKDKQRVILQDQFHKMGCELCLPKPVATVELTAILYTLAFAVPFEDWLEYGVQPFAVAYLSQKLVSEQRKLINMHELLKIEFPTLANILDLKAASKVSMSTNESQMLGTLHSIGVVLAVIVGVSLDLYKDYKVNVIDA